MSNDKVDTNRPEYSWIPFFEELARRLHEDGWRHRQPEIVRELKRAKGKANLNKSVDDLNDLIDPFSIFSMIRTQGFDAARKVMDVYKRIFDLGDCVKLPQQDPIAPYRLPISAMFFSGVPDASQNDILWDLFECVMSTDISEDRANNGALTALLNQSFNDVNNAGTQSISGALYWIQPHRFLKADTIDHFLGDFDYRESAELYLDRLNMLREHEKRTFPELNNEEWFVRQFLRKIDKTPVWQVRGGIGFEFVDQFLIDNYTGISFDIDRVNLSVAMSTNERDGACLDINPALKPDALSQIGKFSWDIRSEHVVVMPVTRNGTELRYGFVMSDRVWYADDGDAPRNRRTVCWRPSTVDGDDLPLPGVAAVRSVISARNELLSRIEDAERGFGGVGPDHDEVLDDGVLTEDEDVVPKDGPRVWVVRADGGKNTATVVANDYTGTEWNELDLEPCVDLDGIKAECRLKYPYASEVAVGRRAGMLNHFLFDMKTDDWVLTPNPPDEGTFYYGMVVGPPAFAPVDDEDVPVDGLPCRQRRRVEWRKEHLLETEMLPSNAWTNSTVHELRGEKREAFLRLIHESPSTGEEPPYTIDTILDEGVFLERNELDRIMAQLERKRNLILQGPPGTGKTFLAKKLAYALMGERADERVVSVQFHQSYAYEDFVGGYRPGLNDADQLVFRARDGAFLELCERARQDADRRYVMLIDETNRGNLSKVFGELFMLIEADKRSERHAVELPHRVDMARNGATDAERFFVPPNVYIIGTMNLADRSLTGMNVAMRRRFGFADLKPQFGNRRFGDWLKTSRFLGDEKMPEAMQREIHRRMLDLNRKIASDPSLSKQYAVGHSFFCPGASHDPRDKDWDEWYRTVIDYEIRPLLDEYWFDDPGKAEREADALVNGMPFRHIDDADTLDVESEETG